MTEQSSYNPLDKINLGKSVADALLHSRVRPLSDRSGLIGAGVYAIYYAGNFEPYGMISRRNTDGAFEQPIYVGKAIPLGARKGGGGFDTVSGKSLGNRLSNHAASIDEAANLDINDFFFRALVVDDIWIPLGENVLIERFQPLWNRVIDGFGNKTPGKGRAAQQRSPWDTIHPGRRYVDKLELPMNNLSEEQILRRISDFFAGKLSKSEILPVNESETLSIFV
jgi:hypothetical protein